MIGIKFNGIDIYPFDVSFLFLVIFLLYIMDCPALGVSAHLFEVVHLIAFFHISCHMPGIISVCEPEDSICITL